MHEETAEPIQNAAQVIEGAAQVDVGNADMPVLVRPQRLLETGSLARCGEVEPVRVRAELQSRDSVLACFTVLIVRLQLLFLRFIEHRFVPEYRYRRVPCE